MKATILESLDICLRAKEDKYCKDFAKLMILYAYITFFRADGTLNMLITFLQYMQHREQLSKVYWSNDIYNYMIQHVST